MASGGPTGIAAPAAMTGNATAQVEAEDDALASDRQTDVVQLLE
jgi:hypothetical protein